MSRAPMREDITPLYRRVIGGLYPLMQGSTRRQWSGSEHIPREGGFVLAANHVSYADPLALGHFLVECGRAPHFLAKSSLLDVPVLGSVIKGTGQIPVYRNTTRASDAYSAAVDGVRRGACVVVLPEGTLTRDPHLWPMTGKSGAARIALDTGCPLIPVALWGTQEVLWPYRGRVPKVVPRKTMHVAAGPPVDLSDLHRPYDAPTLRIATDRVMASITKQLEEIRQESAPEQRVDLHGYERRSDGREGGKS